MKNSLWATTLYESKELVVLCYEHGKCYEPEQKPACCFSNGGQHWAIAIEQLLKQEHTHPHPTDWPTQTSKDFHLGTCILMGGNWSPGQSIGIARLLFDRFSYLHIPLSYTTFRCRLAIKQLTFFNLLHSTQLHIVQHKIYFSCYITFWFGAKEKVQELHNIPFLVEFGIVGCVPMPHRKQ